MAKQMEKKGSCLCKAVRICAKPKSASVEACHCSMCRKWTGGPLLAVDCGADVSFEGKENISIFESSAWAERGFCKQCGTHLFYRLKGKNHYILPTGVFDDNEEFIFDHQIFIDEKPSFYSFSNETKNMTGVEVFAQFAPPASSP